VAKQKNKNKKKVGSDTKKFYWILPQIGKKLSFLKSAEKLSSLKDRDFLVYRPDGSEIYL
jgi:hypothetical protein